MELGFGNVLPLALFPPPFFVVPTSPFFFFFPSIFVCFFGWECPRAMLHVDDLLAKKQPLFTGLHCPTRQFATSEGAKRGTPHITCTSNNVYLPYFLPPRQQCLRGMTCDSFLRQYTMQCTLSRLFTHAYAIFYYFFAVLFLYLPHCYK